jgi:hypothetical protein
MTRPDMPRPDTPDEKKTAATGESEADAARPVRFETRPEAGPAKSDHDADNDSKDAGELAEEKHSSKPAEKAAPGAIPPDELTTESDDGAA